MTPTRSSVVILGAGYAGLLCAIRLARKTRGQGVSITLVNASDTFTQRLLLHQYATKEDIAWQSLPELLSDTGIHFVQGMASQILPERKEVVVTSGREEQRLGYDELIYALGSLTDRGGVPGVAEHAYTLTPRGPLSAEALREALPGVQGRGGRVVVVGGGATGIETAAQVASVYPQIKVSLATQGELAAFIGGGVAKRIRRALGRLSVTITEHTEIVEVGASGLRTADGSVIPYDLCIWTGGFVAPALARETGIQVNERGQIIIDPFMRSVSHPDIFAVGDAAWSREQPGAPLRMSAFTAIILGAHGADSVAAIIRGKTPKPLSFAYLGQGIALGRGNGIGFAKTANDVPFPPYYSGALGYRFREVAVSIITGSFRREKHWLGSLFWLGKNRYARAKRAEANTPQELAAHTAREAA